MYSIGTTVIRVNATDLDIQQNARIIYIIGPGGQDNFRIDQDDGNVFVSVNSRLTVDNPPTYYNVTVRCSILLLLKTLITYRSWRRVGCVAQW